MPDPVRPTVMGVASNLSAEAFLPFLRSLRATSFAGRVVLFVSHLRPADLEELRPWVDELVDVDAAHPPVAPSAAVGALRRVRTTRGLRRHYPRAYRWAAPRLGAAPGNEVAHDLELRLQGAQALRYGIYAAHLEAEAASSRSTHVLISDVRDVVFQDDPFAEPPEALEVFLEEPHLRLADPGFNATWLRDLYGEEGLRQLGDRPVSCSGVTVGPREPMLAYLRAMATELDRHLIPLGPHDQAVHNRLLATGALPWVEAVPNGTGRVLTMGALGEVRRDHDGGVLNADGSRPPVLHQYDRHLALADELLAAVAEGRPAGSPPPPPAGSATGAAASGALVEGVGPGGSATADGWR